MGVWSRRVIEELGVVRQHRLNNLRIHGCCSRKVEVHRAIHLNMLLLTMTVVIQVFLVTYLVTHLVTYLVIQGFLVTHLATHLVTHLVIHAVLLIHTILLSQHRSKDFGIEPK